MIKYCGSNIYMVWAQKIGFLLIWLNCTIFWLMVSKVGLWALVETKRKLEYLKETANGGPRQLQGKGICGLPRFYQPTSMMQQAQQGLQKPFPASIKENRLAKAQFELTRNAKTSFLACYLNIIIEYEMSLAVFFKQCKSIMVCEVFKLWSTKKSKRDRWDTTVNSHAIL